MILRSLAVCILFSLGVGFLEGQIPKAGRIEEPATPGLSYATASSDPVLPSGGVLPPGKRVASFEFSQMKVKVKPPPPAYPDLARIARIQGLVIVEIIVGKDGSPSSVKAILGPAQLRLAAERYASQWRFEPACQNGEPVMARFLLSMPYRLHWGERIRISQAALDVAVSDPSLQALVPALRTEAEDVLRQLGVTRVDDTAVTDRTHQLWIQVSRADEEGSLKLTLRCCLIKDVQAAVSGQEYLDCPTWAYQYPSMPDPGPVSRAELRRALLEMVEVAQVSPNTP
jgi:TonB family protein